jgi:hypothetical protein
MEHHDEFIGSLKTEYINIIQDIKKSIFVKDIRFNVHKLITVVSVLDNNDQIIFLCKQLLMLDKGITDKRVYDPCVNYILEYNRRDLF